MPSSSAVSAPDERRAAGGDDADERELGGAGEDQQRQRAGLQDAEPGGDGDGAEGDAVGAGGEADREAVADDRAALLGAAQGVGVGHAAT